jgi:hypothetical protein
LINVFLGMSVSVQSSDSDEKSPEKENGLPACLLLKID